MTKSLLLTVAPNSLIQYWRRLRKFLIAFAQYWYDGDRFFNYSSMLIDVATDSERLEAQITAHYHVIEKGLSLRKPTLGFGQEVVNSLIERLQTYMSLGYPQDNVAFRTAISALDQYAVYHESQGYDVSALRARLVNFEKHLSQEWGGVHQLSRNTILHNASIPFAAFVESRHSVRNFSAEPVAETLIERAITIAQKSPSVCNRQSSRVYIISDDELRSKILQLQAGNRGFGHLVQKVLIITSDLRSFFDINERNQSFIDGGLFSMSLLYGLHAVGLGACPLNWAVTKEQDKSLRALTGIAESENIIMLAAVGHLPDYLNVAKSKRKAALDICTYL